METTYAVQPDAYGSPKPATDWLTYFASDRRDAIDTLALMARESDESRSIYRSADGGQTWRRDASLTMLAAQRFAGSRA